MSLLSRVLRKRGAFKELARCAVQASTTTHSTLVSTPEPHSIHRRVLPLFDLVPALHEITYVAPNASIVGEVYIDCQVNIWDRAVIRGDLNAVKIHFCSSIKENVCISNVSALPTGLSSATIIGRSEITRRFHDHRCGMHSCLLQRRHPVLHRPQDRHFGGRKDRG